MRSMEREREREKKEGKLVGGSLDSCQSITFLGAFGFGERKNGCWV